MRKLIHNVQLPIHPVYPPSDPLAHELLVDGLERHRSSFEYSNATSNGRDTKTSLHRVSVTTTILRHCQLTATFLPIKTSLFPKNASRNVCLLKQGGGVEAAEEAERPGGCRSEDHQGDFSSTEGADATDPILGWDMLPGET